MTHRLLLATAFTLSLIALPSVSSAAGGKTALHGTWTAVSLTNNGTVYSAAKMGINIKVTLRANGTYSYRMQMGKKTQTESGTWAIKAGKLISSRLKKDGKAAKKTQAFTYTFKHGKLLLTDPKGATLTMQRLVRIRRG